MEKSLEQYRDWVKEGKTAKQEKNHNYGLDVRNFRERTLILWTL